MAVALIAFSCMTAVRAGGSFDVAAAVQFADQTWNCDGKAPPCEGCSTVPDRSWQDPYGCAPYVAHALAAGGVVPKPKCGTLGDYSAVEHDGVAYDLNVVGKRDGNCGSGNCLTDYLLAKGWVSVSEREVTAGTVCAVKGDADWGHIVFGVGPGVVNAHNMAQYHVSISNYQIDLCLNHP
eukprot:ANDGO_06110.mRNA.1 hypothetical protein